MKPLRFFLIAFAVITLLPAGMVRAETDQVRESGSYLIDEDIWNECTGEYVNLTGSIKWSNHVVETKPGILKWNFQYRYQGVRGTGRTTGIQYQVNSGEHGYGSLVMGDNLPYHYAAGGFNTIRLVARGSQPDLVIKHKITVTMTPDFVLRVFTVVDETRCK